MASTKPYFIRAIHEWCLDEGFTPYLSVQVDADTQVPREFVRDGQIVLNISAEATHQLRLGNDEITFQTRFNGASFPVIVPLSSVVAIYARENGQGMVFEAEFDHDQGDESHDDMNVGAGATASSEDRTVVQIADERTERRTGHLTRIK